MHTNQRVCPLRHNGYQGESMLILARMGWRGESGALPAPMPSKAYTPRCRYKTPNLASARLNDHTCLRARRTTQCTTGTRPLWTPAAHATMRSAWRRTNARAPPRSMIALTTRSPSTRSSGSGCSGLRVLCVYGACGMLSRLRSRRAVRACADHAPRDHRASWCLGKE